MGSDPRVIRADIDKDLSLFSSYLWSKGIVHRIYRESHAQVLEVQEASAAEDVRVAYEAWCSGKLVLERSSVRIPVAPPAMTRFLALPGVLSVLLLAWLVFAGMAFFPELFAWFTFVPVASPLDETLSIWAELGKLRVWRWIAPIFLHFTALHIIFNSVVVYELGRRIELREGAVRLWLVVLATGTVSNICQFIAIGDLPFGGLSGVAYALLGYVMVRARLQRAEAAWQLPPGIAVGLIGASLLFTTGITEPFGLNIANTAHWTGLGAGAAIAWVGAPRPTG